MHPAADAWEYKRNPNRLEQQELPQSGVGHVSREAREDMMAAIMVRVPSRPNSDNQRTPANVAQFRRTDGERLSTRGWAR